MTSTPPNGSPLPGNNPNPRGRSTVSFRTHTGPNQSPHFNTSPNFGSSYFPPATESPTRSHAVDERHRAQLATYKRDPNKAAAANRLSVLDNLWGGVGRRLSLIIEDGPSDGKDEKRRARVWFNFRIYLRQWKIRRYLFYFFGLFAIYYFLLRPMLSVAPSSSVSLGSSSAGTKVTSSKKPAKTTSRLAVDSNSTVAPLKARSKIPNRAPLPPGVIFRSLPDHPKERGLLKVDPESQVHPIYQLIRDGREAWDRKVAKQSQTLKEAVAEYKRRYQRLPPKGFDKWWEYVRTNNVQLPDEYDQIHRDVQPFHALSPRDLQKRIETASKRSDTYTIEVRHGTVRTSASYDNSINGADERLSGQTELIAPIAQYLGDLKVVYSVHDTPAILLSWGHRSELLEHIEEDEWIDPNDEIDLSLRGWAAACPQSSRLRTFDRYAGLTSPTPPTSLDTKSFIAEQTSLLDLCDHPELVPLHGALSGKDFLVQPLIPVFSLSKTSFHADVLGVPTEQYVDDLDVKPWSQRTEDKLLWRGSNTGAWYDVSTTWRNSHRVRLLRLANLDEVDGEEEPDRITLLPAPKRLKGETLSRLSETIPWGKVNGHYMNVAFTENPIQCIVEDGTCDDLRDEFRWSSERMTYEEAANYKYVIDVDGNAWSARFKRLLTSGSLIFKSTVMPEWWTDRIQPWVHYIPIQVDYSDLYDALVFFRGDQDGKGGETELAREIAAAGRDWSLTHWRKEDMTAYVFRLYLEWARLVADRRGAMDFVLADGISG